MVQVLMKVVDGMTADEAIEVRRMLPFSARAAGDTRPSAARLQVMNMAHDEGAAQVTICPQEDAERYCEGLRSAGLVSTARTPVPAPHCTEPRR